ncbi:polysaccharide deacetylase [Chitinivibrio alkaliphilus ACht1]|uniref:Polysaccharide deacetylase n=1 Tax=Chitinivibrio alkaliphilus ACht1 TaxID=1313304 RepID=U7DAY7_9BACT|nr:polysaccharide deacetylase [Chitinivibrio alkaliphilus ACht1]
MKRLDPEARVTFYINGDQVNDETIPVMRRATAEGHDVDNHGYYHYSHGGAHSDSRDDQGNQVILETPEEARENIQRNSELIYDITGYWPFSFRAPFFEWGSQLEGLDRKLNMPFVHAIYDTNDWSVSNQEDPEGMAAELLSSDRVRCGTIILMHDAPAGRRQGTVDALQHFIPQLVERGYVFVTVRELFAMKQMQPELFIPRDTWNPNPRVPFDADDNSGRYSHVDFWPDHDTWWENDWWTNPTPPWERDLDDDSGDSDDEITTYTIQVDGGSASAVRAQEGEIVDLTVGTAPEGKRFLEWRVVSGDISITDNSFEVGTSNVVIEAVWESIGGDDDSYIALLPWEWAQWDGYADTTSSVEIHSDGTEGDLVADLNRGESNSYLGLLLWLEESVDFSDATGMEVTYSADRDFRLVLSDTTSYEDGGWEPCGVVLPAGQERTATLSIEDVRKGLPSVSPEGVKGITFYHTDNGEELTLTVTSMRLFGAEFLTDEETSRISTDHQRVRDSEISIAGISGTRLNLNVPAAGTYTVTIHSVDGKLLSLREVKLSRGENAVGLDNTMARGPAIVRVQGSNIQAVKRTIVR